MWFHMLFLIHTALFPSSFKQDEKQVLPLYIATSHAPSLHCIGMNQGLLQVK